MKKLLGQDEYLKQIKTVMPTYFEELDSSKTLYLEPRIVSDWYLFDEAGISTKKKDFIKLTITINGLDIKLDSKCRHYFAYPNKRYIGFGHPKNKKGVLIKLTDEIWNSIKTNGYFDLSLDWELSPNKKDKPCFKTTQIVGDEKENIEVSFASIYAKVHVKNIDSGNHLVVNYNVPNVISYFNKNDRFIEDKNLNIDYIPRSLDLDENLLFWSASHKMEFDIEPYSLYERKKVNDIKYESFNFGDVGMCSKSIERYGEEHFKIIGNIAG